MGSLAGRAWTCIALAIAFACTMAGCDDPPPLELDELMPADSDFYMESDLVPPADQVMAVEALADRFPGGENVNAQVFGLAPASIEDPDARAQFEEQMTAAFGGRVALGGGLLGETPLMVAEIKDQAQAEQALDELSLVDGVGRESGEYEGVSYTFEYEPANQFNAVAFVGDYLLAAPNPDDLEDMIDVATERSESLSDVAPELRDVAVPDEASRPFLGGAIDLRAVLEPVFLGDLTAFEKVVDFLESAGMSINDPVGLSLDFRPDAVEAALSYVPSAQAEEPTFEGMLDEVPPGTFGAFAIDDVPSFVGLARKLQAIAGSGVDGTSLLAASTPMPSPAERLSALMAATKGLGEGALFVQGRSLDNLNGGLLADVEDRRVAGRSLASLRRALEADPAVAAIRDLPPDFASYADPTGFKVFFEDLPEPINVALADYLFAVGYGEGAAESALVDSTAVGVVRFDEAGERLGSDYEPSLILLAGSIYNVIATTPLFEDPAFVELYPYLYPFDLIAVGSKVEDGRKFLRLVTTLRDVE